MLRHASVLARAALSIALLLAGAVACSNSEAGASTPPIFVAYPHGKPNAELKLQLRILEARRYSVQLNYLYERGNAADRAIARRLVGGIDRDSAGKLLEPGVQIPVRIRIARLESEETVLDKETLPVLYSWNGESLNSLIAEVDLTPGSYSVVISSLKASAEVASRPIRVSVTYNPKLLAK